MAGAGRPAYDIIEEQLSGQPAEVRHLVKSINDSLKAGKEVSNIPMVLMALFRPSVQPYLISWYRYNPQEVIAKLRQDVYKRQELMGDSETSGEETVEADTMTLSVIEVPKNIDMTLSCLLYTSRCV